MVDRIEFTLRLPPRELSPNAREGWRAKARVARAYRLEVGLLASQAMRACRWETGQEVLWQRVRVSLVFRTGGRSGRYHPRDVDNAIASMKNGLDGIIDAGVVKSDDAEQLQFGSVRIIRERPPGVTVRLEKLG